MCSRIFIFFFLLEWQLLAFLFFSLNQDSVFNFLDCCSNRVGIHRRQSTECVFSAKRAWSCVPIFPDISIHSLSLQRETYAPKKS